MLGISLVTMKGRHSSISGAASDSDELAATHRTTTADPADRPDEVAAALLTFRWYESRSYGQRTGLRSV